MNFNKTIFASVVALTIITSAAVAQVKKKPAATTTAAKPAAAQAAKPAPLPVDPAVIIGKLPNGLTYYIRSNGTPKKLAYLFLVNKAGSILETDAQQGLAHFVQRMAFDGTRDFPKKDIVASLSKPGTKFNPDINGNTNFDETIYQMLVPTDTAKIFDKSFSLLANIAGYVTFDAVEADQEKATLLQQVQQRAKSDQDRVQQQITPLLLNNSKYAQRAPFGKEEAIKTFTAAAAKSFYHDWYRPDLQAVIAVGDFDAKAVEQLIKTNFSALKNPIPEKPRPQLTVTETPGTVVKTVTDKSISFSAVQIVVRHPQVVIKTPADMLRDMSVNLFNQMLNTRISETLELHNAPFKQAQENYGSFAGKLDAFSAVAEAKPGALEAAVKGITNEMERARKFGFSSSELERAKQNALLQMGNLYSTREQASSPSFLGQYIQNFATGAAIPGIMYSYNYYVNNIGKITVADMNALAAKLITDQNRSIIIEAPEAEKDKLPSEKTLLEWMADASKNAVAYSDDINTQPIMATTPTPGHIVDLKVDSTINIVRLTLKNGVKVILKPTKFQGNQILINGYSFGGTSLVSDADFISANMAAGVISKSGLAGFDQGQLNIKLRGTQLNMSPYINETIQGVSGSAAPGDFVTAMQLLYLYFTQPRKDPEVWQSMINQNVSLLNGRSADPASVYQDTVTALLSNRIPRAMPATIAQFNAASLDKAFDFYKARFADASGFTFTIVGNFAVDQVAPYIEMYLGSLPSTNSKETYKNIGNNPVTGQVSRTIYKGTSDKATVELIYSGKYDYKEENNIQVDALEDILDRRLIARLPEKTSGAYSLSAGINYLKIPDGRYKTTISFLCAPADVDKLTTAITDEINKIKLNGADTTNIKTFINTESRNIQGQLRQNYFWAGYLGSSEQNGEDPDRIIPHIQALNDITPASTKIAANKCLNNDNLIKIVLLPAKEEKK